MLIGTAEVDFETISSLRNNVNEIVSFVENSVPKWARNIPHIKDNQRYYVAIHVRNLLSMPYKERKSITDALINGIRISGVISAFTPIVDILNVCDKKALLEMIRSELNGEC